MGSSSKRRGAGTGVAAGLAAGLAGLAVMGASTGALAAGFQLREQSSEMIGNAFAGSAAKALTAATIWYNPAGMILLSGNQVAGSVSWIAPRATWSGTATGPLGGSTGGGDGGDAIMDAAIGSTFALWDYSKDLKFGVAVVSPFGLRTDYPSSWAGRYWADNASITSIAVNPNFAWRISEHLSIGGGPVIEWTKAKISQSVNQNALYYAAYHTLPPYALPDGTIGFAGEDTAFGVNVGLLWEFSPTSRVGLSYRSEMKNELSGRAHATGALASAYLASRSPTGEVTADLTLPQTATLSVYHELNPQWAVMADVQWTGWSSFDTLNVKGSGGDVTDIEENWRDTWFFSLGASWKMVPGHTLHFGAAYDMGAIEDSAHRYPSIPDADRYWLSTGYTWDVSDKIQWNVGYAHIFGGSADVAIAEASKGSMVGKYDSSVDIVSTSFVYKF